MNETVKEYVKAQLRRIWGKSTQRQTALKLAKVKYGHYKCAHCEQIHRRKDIQVDHKEPIGTFTTFDLYIERLFCPTNRLQVLCKSCHQLKTNDDMKEIRAKKKKNAKPKTKKVKAS